MPKEEQITYYGVSEWDEDQKVFRVIVFGFPDCEATDPVFHLALDKAAKALQRKQRFKEGQNPELNVPYLQKPRPDT